MKTLVINTHTVCRDCNIGDVLSITLKDDDFTTDVEIHINKPGFISSIIIYREITKNFEIVSGPKMHVRYTGDIHVPADLHTAYHIDDLNDETVLKLKDSKHKYDKLNRRK